MKKSLAVSLALGLLGSALLAPATAQEEAAPTVPETVLVEDPVGDANYINAQNGFPDGDHVTPADVGSVTDLMKIWVTHDATNVNFHIQTEAPQPATNGTGFQVVSTPGSGEAGENEAGCLRIVAVLPGEAPTYAGDPFVRLLDRCNVGTSIFDDSVEGQFAAVELEDGTGILTLTFARDYSPLLADNEVLTGLFVTSTSPQAGHPDAGFNNAPFIDDTVIAAEYALTAEEPPAEPPVKKGCKKGSPKAKKKGCKK